VKLAAPILIGQEFLILDEPLNHLDLPMREMLEATLSEYEGTLLLVSHDVYFLEKVCDRVLLFENGRIRRLEESFAEYMERTAAL
jgi:macrolide transport system ATP-binding/permease protein